MPDFDPNSIPILDDVITNDDSDNADDAEDRIEPVISASEMAENITEHGDAEAEEVNLDLFSAKSIENSVAEPIYPDSDDTLAISETGSIDIHIDQNEQPDEFADTDFIPQATVSESALLNYDTDADAAAASVPEVKAEVDEMYAAGETSIQTSAPEPSLAAHTDVAVSLESLVDNVVDQLMPELEQKLRTLVNQALAENLPPDLIRSDASARPDIDD